jgi:hypothetical protein
LNLRLWPWDKTTTLSMKMSKLMETEQSEKGGIKGVAHKDFASACQTVNSAYYCDIRRLHKNVQRLSPELWQQRNLLLHHENAQSHTSFFTRKVLTKNNISRPPPILLSWLVPLRHISVVIEDEPERPPFLHNWCDWHIVDITEQTEHDFHIAFKKWQKRWERCICTEGDYFEGDGRKSQIWFLTR